MNPVKSIEYNFKCRSIQLNPPLLTGFALSNWRAGFYKQICARAGSAWPWDYATYAWRSLIKKEIFMGKIIMRNYVHTKLVNRKLLFNVFLKKYNNFNVDWHQITLSVGCILPGTRRAGSREHLVVEAGPSIKPFQLYVFYKEQIIIKCNHVSLRSFEVIGWLENLVGFDSVKSHTTCVNAFSISRDQKKKKG